MTATVATSGLGGNQRARCCTPPFAKCSATGHPAGLTVVKVGGAAAAWPRHA
jgi:hypothetical protein